jgi:hypothetical protein
VELNVKKPAMGRSAFRIIVFLAYAAANAIWAFSAAVDETKNANIANLQPRTESHADVPWDTFFHTQGRHIVADSTAGKVVFRGYNLNGLEFGAFSNNPYPGVPGANYFVPKSEDLENINVLGANVIRVPFEWARLIPNWRQGNALPAILDPEYLGLLDSVVQLATNQKIYVILDMHDFLKYWSGQNQQVCLSDSSDYQQLLNQTWKLLSGHFSNNKAVLGFDIMNEPVRKETGETCGSCNWHGIAQSVVNSIREVDANHLIFIEGQNYSLASNWPLENGEQIFINDSTTPPRIIYSPHVYFDSNNDSRYDSPDEQTGPVGPWQYYMQDRLIPAIDWSMKNEVPIFIGETNVPCLPGWLPVIEDAFDRFFDPLNISVTLWHYIDPARQIDPLNVAACSTSLIQKHPGKTYDVMSDFSLFSNDSLIYADAPTNPWNTGTGYFDDTNNPGIDFSYYSAMHAYKGNFSISVGFSKPNYAGVKLMHQFGIDTRRFNTLKFRIFLTGNGAQNFKIYTTAPRSDCNTDKLDPIYPTGDKDQPELVRFLPNPRDVGIWQEVEIPLASVVDPKNSIINGIAFKNIGAVQEIFYLDEIALTTQLHATMQLGIASGGASATYTNAIQSSLQAGYATLTVNSGTTPYGTAVFSFKQSGITVSEAGVPASPPTTSARVFIDYRSGVLGVPGRSDSGTVDINTGIAIINYGSNIAHITYTLFNTSGTATASGQGTLAMGNHFAKFINQLNEVASGFVLPANFKFGSLNIVSDQPLSVIALMLTMNQRGESVYTTTPIADMNQPLANTPIYFPQLADGSGWTTSLALMNTSGSIETGSLHIFDNNGLPLIVKPVGGTTASSFQYSIPAGGAFRIQTDGSSVGQKVGWVQLVPDTANSTPIGSGVFGFNPDNVMTTASGVPSALSTTHARIFVDRTKSHNTGLAISNLNKTQANVSIQAYKTDGATPAGASQGLMPLAGLGHDSKFATQLISGLPADFTGVLEISSASPFAAITIRSLMNERDDFLVTTFPIADANRSAPSPIVYPHVANGGGYVTQFILIGPTGAASTTLNFYGEDGNPLAIGK